VVPGTKEKRIVERGKPFMEISEGRGHIPKGGILMDASGPPRVGKREYMAKT